MAENRERIKELERTRKRMERIRAPWEPEWRDIGTYICPRKGRFFSTDATRGASTPNQKAPNPVPLFANKVFASGMQGGLTSPMRPWLLLRLHDQELNRRDAVKIYLNECTTRMLTVLAGSNFYDSAYSVYFELGAFGTASMWIEEDFDDIVRFRTQAIGEFSLDTDARGRVRTVARTFTLPADQVAGKWPDTCGGEITAMAENSPDADIEIVHLVRERAKRDPRKQDAMSMPFESVYYVAGRQIVLSESGYSEWPCPTPRFETTGPDKWGGSPGKDMVKLAALLQNMEFTYMRLAHKAADPPMRVPSTFERKLNTLPGGNTPVDADEKSISPLYLVDPAAMARLETKIEKTEQLLRIGFYNDLFRAISDDNRSNITKAEIDERVSEKMVLIGPTIDRMINEFLKPTVVRVFNIMDRSGILPPPPPEIQGLPIEIEFTSPLAQAQKAAGTQALRSFSSFVGELAKLNPAALDKLSFDETIDLYAEAIGVPPKAVVSTEDANAMRSERAKMQQAQERAAAMQRDAEAVRKLSGVDLSQDNVLSRMANSAEQQGGIQ